MMQRGDPRVKINWGKIGYPTREWEGSTRGS